MAVDLTGLSEEAQSLARVPLFKRLEPHELEKLAEEIYNRLHSSIQNAATINLEYGG